MLGIIFVAAIIVWILVSRHETRQKEKEQQAAYQSWRQKNYFTLFECEWCGRDYELRNGHENFCSQKCIHEYKKANK
jgi:hypothetical protein